MIAHYFTLRALSQEFDSLLSGAVFVEVFTQQRNELIFTFSVHGTHDDRKVALSVSIEPKRNYIIVRDEMSRARKNSTDLFPGIIGKTVRHVHMHPHDRTMMMDVGNGSHLYLQLYDTASSNIFFVEGDRIHEAFKNNKTFADTVFPEIKNRSHDQILNDPREFFRFVKSNPDDRIFKTLKILFPVFGTVYVREVLYRSNIEEGCSAEEMTEEECSRIIENINSFQKELNEPAALLYRCPDGIEIFSVIVLHHRKECGQESFPSVNEGIRSRLKMQFHERRVTTQKDLLLKEIQKELEHTQRALQNISSATVRDPGEFERIGNILLSHVGEISRGTVQVELPNPFDREIPIHISLDPKYSTVQNAQRYFEKAKKARLANEESERRHRLYEQREKLLRELEAGLQKCTSPDELKAWLSQHTNTLKTMNIIVEKEKDTSPPFRIFSVSGELEVWVGKSSANNDLLTMKYAKPNDLWFHIRGASGSHTVLKVHGKDSPASKEAIRQAAAIAAYYSKMRNAGNVPVAYCERKYVFKRKGLKEGAVVMEHEKVIFVKPALP